MHTPTVTFIVPCYKLAHLLPACVNSILSQTYGDLEVLIMDDCSPDNTPEVARSFRDPRVKHIRNEPNLGHLRNYNKGIGLARGNYVWLISADDYLLRDYVLQRYVDLMEAHPKVGYTFCPGAAVGSGADPGFERWVSYGQRIHGKVDRIFKGHNLLKALLKMNTIVAASGLVRRECYERVSVFRMDMPWACDWYLWCLFALHYDVGYFSEPMVCYREHEHSMTNQLWKENVVECCEEDVAIPWAIKQQADQLRYRKPAKYCLEAIVQIYAGSILSRRYRMEKPFLNLELFEASLRQRPASVQEKSWVRARVFAALGSEYYWRGERASAKELYRQALETDPWMIAVYVKQLLLSLGRTGDAIWRLLKPSMQQQG